MEKNQPWNIHELAFIGAEVWNFDFSWKSIHNIISWTKTSSDRQQGQWVRFCLNIFVKSRNILTTCTHYSNIICKSSKIVLYLIFSLHLIYSKEHDITTTINCKFSTHKIHMKFIAMNFNLSNKFLVFQHYLALYKTFSCEFHIHKMDILKGC